ncbi:MULTISPECIES: hypothetical protein [unclassified Rhizobium]|uniref:hypothetical protein n=1 Tax=unclassified Rhizobium TaxID=2613769 RepID=UPI000CDF4EC2|nr:MULTISPECIES: hypothetical protein [Rhizobium]AVA23469.1 hypothetical protein NXC24_CH03858 [Rhizobium sp. NXC24]UWU20814.1 hypothetical protein N2601_16305 [Rhizobium tropici]
MIQVSATLPANFIAFEYATGDPDWWYDVAEGLSEVIVKNGFIDVIDRSSILIRKRPGAILPRTIATFSPDSSALFVR